MTAEPQSAARPAADQKRRRMVSSLLFTILVFFVAGVAGALLLQRGLGNLEQFGYVGVFLISLLGTATIVLPMPSMAFTFAMGGALASPLLVGLIAGTGETLGELTGYLAGYSGSTVVEDRERYDRLASQMQRYGGWLILVMAAIPNPAFDLVGLIAGGLRYPVVKFLLACWPGKTLKAVLVAYAGAGMLPWLAELISRANM